jgi:hypothetical protein
VSWLTGPFQAIIVGFSRGRLLTTATLDVATYAVDGSSRCMLLLAKVNRRPLLISLDQFDGVETRTEIDRLCRFQVKKCVCCRTVLV